MSPGVSAKASLNAAEAIVGSSEPANAGWSAGAEPLAAITAPATFDVALT